MVRPNPQRVLLIGDLDRQVQAALLQALPGAQVVSAATLFDGIAELAGREFTAVLTAVEPLERRPEAALQTLRELAGDARLILFGDPTLEPLSRRMLQFGGDDYVVSPPSPRELQEVFGTPLLRLADGQSAPINETPVAPDAATLPLLQGLPAAEVLADALLEHPGSSAAALIQRMSALLGPAMELSLLPADAALPDAGPDRIAVARPVHEDGEPSSQLCLIVPADQDSSAARHLLSRLAQLVGKVQSLQERHLQLQRAATTDDLTGLYNARYFRHALRTLLDKARQRRFPVTLLLFDLDNFKKYNDTYGHPVGDEILRQTASLMRRCCREHDIVARRGGDEFAVVFWEKEGPRQPRDLPAGTPATPSKPPSSVLQIIERFRKLLASQTFEGLGPGGRGVLTISGGLAQFPYDGRTVDELLKAADDDLVFRAKRLGKNSIFLVGSDEKVEPGKFE